MVYEQSPKIVVSDEIKSKLDRLKLVSDESYNSVIIRLIDKARTFDKRVRT